MKILFIIILVFGISCSSTEQVLKSDYNMTSVAMFEVDLPVGSPKVEIKNVFFCGFDNFTVSLTEDSLIVSGMLDSNPIRFARLARLKPYVYTLDDGTGTSMILMVSQERIVKPTALDAVLGRRSTYSLYLIKNNLVLRMSESERKPCDRL
jgi:hypothetical protein